MLRIENIAAEHLAETRTDVRRHHEKLLALASVLTDADRLLLEQVLDQQMPISELARMARVPRRGLQHRFDALIHHLQQKRFRYLAAHLDKIPRGFQAVAKAHFLQRRTLRDTVRITGRSLHHVRQICTRIDAILDVETRRWDG